MELSDERLLEVKTLEAKLLSVPVTAMVVEVAATVVTEVVEYQVEVEAEKKKRNDEIFHLWFRNNHLQRTDCGW
jgi:hypothetical protein